MTVLPLCYGADIPQFFAGGVRKQMKQLFITRFMFYAALIVMILIICVGLLIWLELKRPERDNAILYSIILGFATTNIGVVLVKAATDRGQIVLQEQNVVLDKVHDKMNGGTQKLLDALRAEHDLAMVTLREEARRERHALKGDLHVEMLKVEHFQTENTAFIGTIHELRARIDDLTAKLVECAKQGSKAEGKLEAAIEQKTESTRTSHE